MSKAIAETEKGSIFAPATAKNVLRHTDSLFEDYLKNKNQKKLVSVEKKV